VLSGAKVHVNVGALGQSVSGTLPIPDIHLTNIGTAEGGVSAAELSRQVLQPVLVSATKAAAESATGLAKDIKNIGTNGVNKAVSGVLNGLFKKK
jgi:hypothetical protein